MGAATAWAGGVQLHRLASSPKPVDRKPTAQQWVVMGFMFAFLAEEDRMPNRRDICNHFGWRSLNAADAHIKFLVNKGFLERRGSEYRFARTERGREALERLQAKEQGEQLPTTQPEAEGA